MKFFDYLHREYRDCLTCKCNFKKPDLHKDCINCVKICGHCPPIECFINNYINTENIKFAEKKVYKVYGENSNELIERNIKNVLEKREFNNFEGY